MKPYDRVSKLMRNFIDFHIPKLRNWWEGEPVSPKSKKTEKQRAKKEIQDELGRISS